ncbi:UNVERIFIED_CONTAM: hypothetical protein FKN15_070450 [Acipenser sinensis]
MSSLFLEVETGDDSCVMASLFREVESGDDSCAMASLFHEVESGDDSCTMASLFREVEMGDDSCVMASLFPAHIVAHLFNIERYHESQSMDAEELLKKLSCLGENSNETYLNPIRTYDTSTTKEVFMSISGATGVIITVGLVLMFTSSTQFIRRSFHELFWFTHHLFVVVFIGLVFHGAGQIVRGQTVESLSNHNVSYCKDHLSEWGHFSECPSPEFAGSSPSVRLLYSCTMCNMCFIRFNEGLGKCVSYVSMKGWVNVFHTFQ